MKDCHVIPETEDGCRSHDHGTFCWCQPIVDTVPPFGGRIVIHRRTLDSPHREPPGQEGSQGPWIVCQA